MPEYQFVWHYFLIGPISNIYADDYSPFIKWKLDLNNTISLDNGLEYTIGSTSELIDLNAKDKHRSIFRKAKKMAEKYSKQIFSETLLHDPWICQMVDLLRRNTFVRNYITYDQLEVSFFIQRLRIQSISTGKKILKRITQNHGFVMCLPLFGTDH